MVGHVKRDGHEFVKPVPPVAESPEHQVGLRKAIVKGTAEIRDKDGNLKGTFEFGGEGDTHLTPEEFEKEFGVPVNREQPAQEEKPVEQGGSENGGDSHNDGKKRRLRRDR